MKKAAKRTEKHRKGKAKAKARQPAVVNHDPGNKARFDQLLDDAIFGVQTKKKIV
jgi:hypothetical protein